MSKLLPFFLISLILLASGCISQDADIKNTSVTQPIIQDQEEKHVNIPEENDKHNEREILEKPHVPNVTIDTGPKIVTGDIIGTVQACDAICDVDVEAYCAEERVITINGVDITGTCRAFSKTGHIDEFFHKCEGFCEGRPESETICYINGETDSDCDGSIISNEYTSGSQHQ